MSLEHIIRILSNDELSFFGNLLVWVNFFAACTAMYFNWKASKEGIYELRRVNFLAVGLAFIYACLFLWILLFDPSYFEWNSPVRGVQIVGWFIVWILPPILSIRVWQRTHRKILETTKKYEKYLEE